jgi:hypothetical protein
MVGIPYLYLRYQCYKTYLLRHWTNGKIKLGCLSLASIFSIVQYLRLRVVTLPHSMGRLLAWPTYMRLGWINFLAYFALVLMTNKKSFISSTTLAYTINILQLQVMPVLYMLSRTIIHYSRSIIDDTTSVIDDCKWCSKSRRHSLTVLEGVRVNQCNSFLPNVCGFPCGFPLPPKASKQGGAESGKRKPFGGKRIRWFTLTPLEASTYDHNIFIIPATGNKKMIFILT